MDKRKAIKIIEVSKEKALKKTIYYSLKNKLIAQIWRDKVEAYELARRALLKEIDYDEVIYE